VPGPKIKSVGLPKSAAAISVDYLMRDNYRLSRVERQRKAKKFSVKILTEKFFAALDGRLLSCDRPAPLAGAYFPRPRRAGLATLLAALLHVEVCKFFLTSALEIFHP